jgi:hypothetical protein
MKGVPYPVYGKDETGYGQMMYPGAEYTFPGQMVYEKPMMQRGGQSDDDREMLEGVADMLRRVRDSKNRREIANYMMGNFRDENVSFKPKEFLASANIFAQGGQMIRRADGSYSQRGMWDNIRENAGSGKKPTRAMLEQERKIKAKK